MPRFTRNTAILAKIESAYGVDPVPTGDANAMLISNQSINPLNSNNIDRDLVRSYFGASEQLVGDAYVEISFDIELQNGGTAGEAPGYGCLLRACGFAESLLATPARVEYTPVSTGQESVTIYYYDDGVLHKALGCRGNVVFKPIAGQRPVMSFKFFGLDGGMSEATPGSLTLTGFKVPQAVTNPNTGDVTLGGTYAAGAITGGTAYPSRGLEVDCGNNVQHIPLLGGESADITGRDMTGKATFDLTAAQEVTFMTAVKATATQSLSLLHGTTAGHKVLLVGAAVQLINPAKEDFNGRRLIGYGLRFLPVSGNDEFRLVLL
ncbi:MAG: hypothetical protein H6R10_702 [Rhodocyclaceae bacterium]|nr:hypothetical protein [Rhodocyclaceae bacterium]